MEVGAVVAVKCNLKSEIVSANACHIYPAFFGASDETILPNTYLALPAGRECWAF